MKKYLGIILAILTVLSCSVFASPVTVDTVETANETTVDVTEVFEVETTEETADLQAESEYGRLVYSLDLEQTGTLGVANYGGEVSTGWYTWQQVPKNSSFSDFSGFDTQMYFLNYNGNDKLYVVDDGTGNNNKAFKFDAHYKWSRLNLFAGAATSYYPAGDYTLVYDVWVDDSYDWSTSHIAEVSSSVVFSSTTSATMLSSPVAKLKSGTNKLTNTVRFRVAANTTDRFQIMQDTPWNTENKDLVVTDNVSNLTLNYYLDNVKLYYQGPATVTFSSSVEASVPAALTNVLPGTKLNLSSYKATAADESKGFVGWALTEGGDPVASVEVLKDTTLYAVYQELISETHPQYGQLAYWVDFNDATLSGNSHDYVAATTAFVAAPEGFPAVSALKIKAYNSDSGVVVDDGVFCFDGGYPRVAVATDGANPFPEGCYTVVYSAKADISGGVSNVLMVNGVDEAKWPTTAAPVAAELAKLTDSFKEYSSSVVYSIDDNGVGKVVGAKGTFEDMTLGKLGMYFTYTTDRKVKRYVDYIKIYWSPLVDISYDANGKDVAVPAKQEKASLFNPAKQPVCEDVGTARFAGWSTSPNGNIITEPVSFVEDTTLYAIWDENFYEGEDEKAAGDLVISFNYNNMDIGNHHSNIWVYGTTEGKRVAELIFGGTKPGSGPWFPEGNKNTDGTWIYGFKYGEYGVVGSYKHPDNAFLIDQKITDGTTMFPKVYLPASGTLKDGIYTMFVEVSVTLAENATVAADSFVNVKLNGESEYKDMAVNKAALALDGEKYYLKKTIFVKDGYYGGYESGAVHAISGEAKSKIGFNFTIAPVDPKQEARAMIECDNFKIYYRDYTYAPVSYKENSIRVNDPSGIRFKASVSTLERNDETVTEYGFIVARKTSLDTAGITPEDFTTESGVKFSKGVAYGTVDGESVDKIFETVGGQTFFTAVVYNIPADKYAEDIVVKPYIVKGGETIYGTAMVNNIKAVAEAIKKTDNYELYKDTVDKIIAGKQL